MNDRLDLRLLLKNFGERGTVGDIDLVEGRALAGNGLDAVDNEFLGVVEVVDDDDVIALV